MIHFARFPALTRGAVACFLSACAADVAADTLTWRGGAGSHPAAAFVDPANWANASGGTRQAPEGGDVLVFADAVTLGSRTDFSLFDFGPAGLTIRKDTGAECKSYVGFAGTGKLVIEGTSAAWLQLKGCTHTGGTEIRTVGVQISDVGSDNTLNFGTGPIDIYADEAGTYGYLVCQGRTIISPIAFHGKTSGPKTRGAIWFSGASRVTGLISADDDIRIRTESGENVFSGGLSAPGKTVRFVMSDRPNHVIRVDGDVDASIEKGPGSGTQGTNALLFCGACTNAGSRLLVTAGTFSFEPRSRWAGTRLEARGAGAALRFSDSETLVNGLQSALSLEEDARISFGVAHYLYLGSVVTNGAPVAPGVYSPESLPGVFADDSANGWIVVGASVWEGPLSDGRWEDPENWSGAVPADGGVAVFTNAAPVTVAAGDVDIGAAGVSVVNERRHVYVDTRFSGEGALHVYGAQEFHLRGRSSFRGGCHCHDGLVHTASRGEDSLGTGPAHVYRSLDGKWSCLVFSFGDASHRNDIVIEDGVRSGGARPWALYFTNRTEFDRSVNLLARTDFTVRADAAVTFNGRVSAPGCVYTADAALRDIVHQGEVDASVCKTGAATLVLNGVSAAVTNALDVREGVVTFGPDGRWGGTNVVIGAGGALKPTSESGLPQDATLSVTTGGVIDMSACRRLAVKGLVVDGVPLPRNRRYREADLPGVIAGGGVVKVGSCGLVLVFR